MDIFYLVRVLHIQGHHIHAHITHAYLEYVKQKSKEPHFYSPLFTHSHAASVIHHKQSSAWYRAPNTDSGPQNERQRIKVLISFYGPTMKFNCLNGCLVLYTLSVPVVAYLIFRESLEFTQIHNNTYFAAVVYVYEVRRYIYIFAGSYKSHYSHIYVNGHHLD